MKNKLLKNNLELMREYNYDKNKDVDLEKITIGSGKKIWWKCNKCHEYQAEVINRNNGRGCPYCSGKKVLVGYNDLTTTNPELASEWNYEKNGQLMPTEITNGSNKMVWWKCKAGHEWQAPPNRRKTGTGCPYCANKKIKIGYNDLATTHPELTEEWDYEKNGKLKPTSLSSGSNKKVWWKCSKGHEWSYRIVDRVNRNDGCPYCSNHKIIVGENDLLTNNPELIKEWNYEKNGKLKPEEFSSGSGQKVWWKCSKGHEWEATISRRIRGNRCPICMKERSTSLSEKIVLYYVKKYFKNTLENYSPDGFGKRDIDIYVPEINVAIEYDGQQFHKSYKKDLDKDILCDKSNIKLYRIREPKCIDYESNSIKIKLSEITNKELEVAIKDLLKKMGKEKVDICISDDLTEIYKMIEFYEKEKSLGKMNPNASKDWNYEKNGNLTPESVFANSRKKVWWTCNKGHEYIMSVCDKNSRGGCPICSNQKLLVGYNDLATTNPVLAKDWNYERNGKLKPTDVFAKSPKKVWWKCEKGHEWEATLNSRSSGSGCPICSNRKVLVGYNDLATTHPKLVKEWNYEKNKNLKPTEVTAGSHNSVWWKCSTCGYEWQSTLVKRTSRGHGCPICGRKKMWETRRKNNNV